MEHGADPVRDRETFTWQTTVSNLQPGESRGITLNSTVDFTSEGEAGELTLLPQDVLAKQILALRGHANRAAGSRGRLQRDGRQSDCGAGNVSVVGQWNCFKLDQFAIAGDGARGSAVNVPLQVTSDPFYRAVK